MSEENKELDPESQRLKEADEGQRTWRRWGPYLSERQWGTVREDYSDHGDCWSSFPHDEARSRAYRWGEDGLMGICDRKGKMCFALALWNGKDPILKERLFGLNGHEGNHGEDVKEEYFYLDSTPTHSWFKGLYKYPQKPFPYNELLESNQKKGKLDPEVELRDLGMFDEDRYFDVEVRYAKNKPNDILIEIEISNRGPEEAELHLLPTLWFRNIWSWGNSREDNIKPGLHYGGKNRVETRHPTLGRFFLDAQPPDGSSRVPSIYTENDTRPRAENNSKVEDLSEKEEMLGNESPPKGTGKKVGGSLATLKETLVEATSGVIKTIDPKEDELEEQASFERPHYKDAFHRYVVDGIEEEVNPNRQGTKCAFHYQLKIPAKGMKVVKLRLYSDNDKPLRSFDEGFDRIMKNRKDEADRFYETKIPKGLSEDQKRIVRQAYAGLLWSKQFYNYVVRDWLRGSEGLPSSEHRQAYARNRDWEHLYNRNVISMPDKWEYPWYAAWDLAFHMIPFCTIDQGFAEDQLSIFLKETYMHPNGQIPAYEFAFDDVNPPVHAWACWRVYKNSGPKGARNRQFLAESFQKLLLNFTWWVNRKDVEGKNLFSGGFLGLDNISVFDRSNMPPGCHLIQADGTAWMAFYCGTMLRMAMELASENKVYENMAIKFFHHFLSIADSMNTLGGSGLWDEEDGFYYDRVIVNGYNIPLKVRSMVGVVPLFAATILREEVIMELPRFEGAIQFIHEEFKHLTRNISWMEAKGEVDHHRYLLAIPSRLRLKRVLGYLLDEKEFLSPYGLRSLSKVHEKHPVSFEHEGREYRVSYDPAESTTALFGGNSNWRGPVWFPLNHLVVESLWRYYNFYGDDFVVECPVGSGKMMNLKEVACELSKRLTRLFEKNPKGVRPCYGEEHDVARSRYWQELLQYHEYFHGETGKGIGASHQTGWTALVINCYEAIEKLSDPKLTPR